MGAVAARLIRSRIVVMSQSNRCCNRRRKQKADISGEQQTSLLVEFVNDSFFIKKLSNQIRLKMNHGL